MDISQFDHILKSLDGLKKTTSDLAVSMPKMMEDFYNTLSPKHKEEYLKTAKSMKVEKAVADVAERIKQMNKK